MQPIADALVAFLDHPQTSAPLSIAVKGPWGAGKSTFMKLVRDGLDPREPDGSRARISLPRAEPTSWRGRMKRLGRPRHRGPRPGQPPPESAHDEPAASKTSSPSEKGLTVGDVYRIAGDDRPSELPPLGGAVVTGPGTADTPPASASGPGPRHVTVWFNPWEYQTGEQVWAGLAHELIDQVSGRLSRSDREFFWLRLNLARVDRQAVRRTLYKVVFERAAKPLAALAVAAVILAVAVTAAAAAATFSGGAFLLLIEAFLRQRRRPATSLYQTLVDGSIHDRVRAATGSVGGLDSYAPDPGYAARTGYVHLIQTDIRRVIELAATKERPLVIFVDDLDRCTPSVVLQVLEAINLFLAGDLPHCVFVLGIEPNVLAAHIETNYEKLLGALRQRDPRLEREDLSWRFLEKLVQLSVRVPDPSPAAVNGYLDHLLGPAGPAPAIDSMPAGPVPAGARASGPPSPDRDDRSQAADGLASTRPPPRASPDMRGGPSDEREMGSTTVAPEIEEQAKQAIARHSVEYVEQLLRFDDPRIREMVTGKVHLISTNPRSVKRVVNLFVFHSHVAARRALLQPDQADLVNDLGKVLDLAELVVRWPQLADRLAAPADGAPTTLQALAAVAHDEGKWRDVVESLALVRLIVRTPTPNGTPPAPDTEESPSERDGAKRDTVPLDDLRLFLTRVSGSVPLMAKLV